MAFAGGSRRKKKLAEAMDILKSLGFGARQSNEVAAYTLLALLDLGTNRYVMTRTEDLSPLLDLPRTTLSLEGSTLTNTGDLAAVGVVTDSDVLDLFPGEAREIDGTRAEGWNARL